MQWPLCNGPSCPTLERTWWHGAYAACSTLKKRVNSAMFSHRVFSLDLLFFFEPHIWRIHTLRHPWGTSNKWQPSVHERLAKPSCACGVFVDFLTAVWLYYPHGEKYVVSTSARGKPYNLFLTCALCGVEWRGTHMTRVKFALFACAPRQYVASPFPVALDMS